MRFIYKDSAYLKNLLCRIRSPTRSPGAQCSCIRIEQPYARLVLLTFATGSNVSVVIKHEIQFVLVYLTGIRGLINLLFVPDHIVLAEHKS